VAEAKLVTVDRSYWNDKASPKVIGLLDQLLDVINEMAEPKQQLNFNKYYVGLTDGVRSSLPGVSYLSISFPSS